MLESFKLSGYLSTDVGLNFLDSLPTYCQCALACVTALALYRLLGFNGLIISSHEMQRDPPGPRGVPLFGNEFQIPSDKQWLCFHDWSKQYGADVFHIRE